MLFMVGFATDFFPVVAGALVPVFSRECTGRIRQRHHPGCAHGTESFHAGTSGVGFHKGFGVCGDAVGIGEFALAIALENDALEMLGPHDGPDAGSD
jgi:hypothetical protein